MLGPRIYFAIITLVAFAIALASPKQRPLPPLRYPISSETCPALPTEQRTKCGEPTWRICDTPTAQCAGCKPATPVGLALNEYTSGQDLETTLSPLEYTLFKSIEAGYMVEFLKNPLPWDKKVDLPFCGFSKLPTKRDETTIQEDLSKRVNFPSFKGGNPLQAVTDILTPPIVNKFNEELGKLIQQGAASVDIPGTSKRPPRVVQPPLCLPLNITVPIHFTVFTTNFTTAGLVSHEVLLEQVRRTNEAYLPLGIQFYISTLSYHVGEEWRDFTQNRYVTETPEYNRYAEAIKAQNRYGGNDEANIWIVERIDREDCDRPTRVNGFCWPAKHLKNKDHDVDGCVVDMDTLPGVKFKDDVNGTGDTLTHELGHWFDLEHVFPTQDEVGCAGLSDGILDTFQFPNNVSEMFLPTQRECCVFPGGPFNLGRWDYCTDGRTSHVTNYMSYSPHRGQLLNGDALGTRPWTLGQRVHMFAAFFTIRRSVPPQGVDINCNDYVVYPDNLQTGLLQPRSFLDLKLNKALKGKRILQQGDFLRKTIERICSKPPDPNKDSTVHVSTGEEVICDNNGCHTPAESRFCPDGSTPPCGMVEVCNDNGLPPCEKAATRCEDGSAPPCPGPPTCGDKVTPKTPVTPPITSPGTNPVTPGSNTASCPKPCNVHFNTCDATTAPTCIYPDPRSPNPRAACACRPGFKATNVADGDSSKHWRLPIVGQEHRVWVAEGIKCDTQCSGFGVDSCREVVEISKACIG